MQLTLLISLVQALGTEVVLTPSGMCCIESKVHNVAIFITIKCDGVHVSAYMK